MNILQSSRPIYREEIREYSVMIDSKDRNYQVYTDPFNYQVIFDPIKKSKEIFNGKTIVYEQPMPIIDGKFTNVRYIKLESVILPFYHKIKFVKEIIDDEPFLMPKVDTINCLTDDLYVVMSLGAYTDINYKSTNDVLSESFAIIYFDKKINNTHYLGKTLNGIRYFPPDSLETINRLKISFMNPYGEPYFCDHLDKDIKSNMICECSNPDGDDDTDCFKHNLFHPLNPIFQHHIHLKIGVVENKLNMH